MVSGGHQIACLEDDVSDFFFVETGQLLGQPFQRGAGDNVFGISDIGGKCRIVGAAGRQVASGIDAEP